MDIRQTRRVSQVFFLVLFFWFCLVMTMGLRFTQLSGWPVNWFLEMDPLAAIGVWLATGEWYRGMLWAVAVLILTFFLGRVFCGWICPLGALHQFFGWLGRTGRKAKVKREKNRPRWGRSIKYYILAVFLAAALLSRWFTESPGALLTGLLDPIPLVYRSVNLTLLPLTGVGAMPRGYDGAALIGLFFLTLLLLNLWIPRFFCRFMCPLGALLGVCSRLAVWRVGKTHEDCSHCKRCEWDCEGACEPDGRIEIPECVMCMNCLKSCPDNVLTFQARPSAGGEELQPDVSRRGFLASLAGGALAVPVLRLTGALGENWNSGIIRPPGSLHEEAFLSRCLKCGQCMRACPSNIIHPLGAEHGPEKMWTPELNFRIGTSGCQYNCATCGNVCPTGAIKPLTLDEKHGAGAYEARGPIRMGTAFIDRGRCLPWAMDRPCIVCQENCPVSPKAIFIREELRPVRDGQALIRSISGSEIRLADRTFKPKSLNTGDYNVLLNDGTMAKVLDNDWQTLYVESGGAIEESRADRLQLRVRLQLPYIDLRYCIGCGICEHECPVSGKRAIRVYAENETREEDHALML